MRLKFYFLPVEFEMAQINSNFRLISVRLKVRLELERRVVVYCLTVVSPSVRLKVRIQLERYVVVYNNIPLINV